MTGSIATKQVMAPGRYEVPLLNDKGDNYTNWSRTMKLLLQMCGLLGIVDSTTLAPDQTADPTGYAE
jgi:Domain of unknown function (DUF4219)